MAKITHVIDAKNRRDRWRVTYVNERGHGRHKTFKNYGDACLILFHAENIKFNQRTAAQQANADIFSVKKTLEYYIGSQFEKVKNGRLRPAYFDQQLAILGATSEEFKTLKISDISPMLIKSEVKPSQIKTLRKAIELVRPFFNIAHNQAPKTKAKKRKRLNIPDDSQIQALFDHATDPRTKIFIYLASICGLRKSEIMPLTFDKLHDRYILIDCHLSSELVVQGLKNESLDSFREVSINPQFHCLISDSHKRKYKYLIYNERLPNQIRPIKQMERDLKSVYMATNADYTIHSLRHYAVSKMIEQGRNILEVKKLAGHKNISTTVDTYGHLFDRPEPVKTKIRV